MGANSWCSTRCSRAQGSVGLGWILMSERAGLTHSSHRLTHDFQLFID